MEALAEDRHVEPLLHGEDEVPHRLHERELFVDRFLRQHLGWDEYRFLEHEGDFDSDNGDGAPDGRVHRRAVYMRCAGDQTNPLYPAAPCAPTIDDLRFETVSLDIVQPGELGPQALRTSDSRSTV